MNFLRLVPFLALVTSATLAGCGQEEETLPPFDEAAVPPMQGGQGADPEMMELMMEMQTIEQELTPIQQQALETDEIADQLVAVQMQIEAAMREEDPALLERIEAFEAEVTAAQQSGDQERLQALGQEAQELQQAMQALEASLFERPEIRDPVEAFEAAHRARMIEIDPEVETKLDRRDEIMEVFQAQAF